MKSYLSLILGLFLCIPFSYSQETLQKIEGELRGIMEKIAPSIVEIQFKQDPVKWDDIEKDVRKSFAIIRKKSDKQEEINVRELSPRDGHPLADSGIGFILDKEGHILTGDFIKKAKEIMVKLANGNTVPAEVKGVDDRTPIGILKIKADSLQPVSLGDSDRVTPGTFIFAAGNPYGMGQCFNFGIVSAPARFIKGQSRLPITIPLYPGDKGGAIFNLKGELIAIMDGVVHYQDTDKNSKKIKVKVHSFNEGMNKFKEKMEDFGKKMKERFDIEIGDEDWDDFEKDQKNSWPPIPSTPSIPSFPSFEMNGEAERGMSLALPINGLKATIETLKMAGKISRGWLGVRVSSISPALKAQLPQLQDKEGIQIDEVLPGSPAEKAGLQKWDIIVKFGETDIRGLDHFRQIVEQTSGPVPLIVIRGAREIVVEVNIALDQK